MSTLKFKGSSSGEVSLTVPATVANQTIKLPAAAPVVGQSLKATDTSGTLEWADIASGGSTDEVFWLNDQTITTSYTVPSGKNAGTFGPVAVASGAVVTVKSGDTWTVV